MADELLVEEKIDEIADTTVLVFDKLGDYGSLIAGSLYLVVGAMLVIYIVHRLAGKCLSILTSRISDLSEYFSAPSIYSFLS